MMVPKQNQPWARYSEEKLLQLQIADLDLHLQNTPWPHCFDQLLQNLRDKQLKFKPYFWLSDDWYTPDGLPGIAIPFYLAHPRLIQLEEQQVLEAEGNSETWFMKLLRHECGHAIDNAFQLRRRKQRRQLFGKSSTPYRDHYSPQPYSKKFVQHLDGWYAQSHPDEDFAETFAVWLTPESDWKTKYSNWPVLEKLQSIDTLMTDLIGKIPINNKQRETLTLPELTFTLQTYYDDKRKHLGLDVTSDFFRGLDQLFSERDRSTRQPSAVSFLKSIRKKTVRLVAKSTGVYRYTVDQVIQEMIQLAKQQNLYLCQPVKLAREEFIAMLTVHIMNHVLDKDNGIPR